jgi:cob(I)alamin adenosyltransferase
MGRGNPRVSVRFEPEDIEKIERTIEQLKKTSAWPPWDVSDFVRKCVTEKLAKMHRSRTWRRRKKELRRQREEKEAARQRDAA